VDNGLKKMSGLETQCFAPSVMTKKSNSSANSKNGLKLYLAGPMTGYPKFNFPAFDYAAAMLRARGFEVFSPAENDRETIGCAAENSLDGDQDALQRISGFDLRAALRDDTHYICVHADGIALLPGWEKSKGATAEHALAVALGHTVIILGKEFLI